MESILTIVTTIIDKYGFPTFVALWFMWRDFKREQEILKTLHTLVVVNAVIAKTMNVPAELIDSLPSVED